MYYTALHNDGKPTTTQYPKHTQSGCSVYLSSEVCTALFIVPTDDKILGRKYAVWFW